MANVDQENQCNLNESNSHLENIIFVFIITVTCLIQIEFGAMVRSSYTVVGACCENPKTLMKPQGPVSRKSQKLLGPEKPFAKLRPAYSVKLPFSYLVKGIKIKITAKFRASRRPHFEDTRRIMSPEMHPKSFRTFEKWAPGLLLII